jgi:hypothetical protein
MRVMGDCLVWALVAVLCLPCVALADRLVPVTDKPRPDYDAPGIRAGAFLVQPELTVGLEYNDNIYATRRDKDSDAITILSPRVGVRSNWSRHSLGIDSVIRSGIYASESDENYLDGHIILDGRLDILRQSFLTGRAGLERLHHKRGDPDVEGEWDEPSVYNRQTGILAYNHDRGKVALTVGAGVINYDYEKVEIDGISISQDFRNRNVYNVNARLGYNLHPAVTPLLITRYEWRRYDEDQAERDSDGFRIGIGTGFELSGVRSIEIYGGYMHQSYDERSNIGGFWYGMTLLWNPTQVTSLQAMVQSSIKETTQAGSSGIEGFDSWVRVDQEVLRNLLIGARIDYVNNDYEGVDLREEYLTYGPVLTYLWNPNFSAEAQYNHGERKSSIQSRDYRENRFNFLITGRF